MSKHNLSKAYFNWLTPQNICTQSAAAVCVWDRGRSPFHSPVPSSGPDSQLGHLSFSTKAQKKSQRSDVAIDALIHRPAPCGVNMHNNTSSHPCGVFLASRWQERKKQTGQLTDRHQLAVFMSQVWFLLVRIFMLSYSLYFFHVMVYWGCTCCTGRQQSVHSGGGLSICRDGKICRHKFMAF